MRDPANARVYQGYKDARRAMRNAETDPNVSEARMAALRVRLATKRDAWLAIAPRGQYRTTEGRT